MYELPTEIMIEERPYRIRNNGDYRMVLDVFSVLEDEELNQEERFISALIIFYEDLNEVEDVYANANIVSDLLKQMFWFLRGGKDEDDSNTKNQKLIDWNGDSDIIISAINNVAGREVRAEQYTHWWTFLAYYMAIGDSILSTVVGIRNKMMNSKPLDKWEREYRNRNPQYFNWQYKTADEIDAEKWLKSVWNKE
jgi:hypothetical protein